MDITVVEVPEQHRYEARVEGQVAGYAEYRRTGDVVTIFHTVVEPAHEGRGIGGALARAALDDVRAEHGSVVPLCPFVLSWIERHPDYADLVA